MWKHTPVRTQQDPHTHAPASGWRRGPPPCWSAWWGAACSGRSRTPRPPPGRNGRRPPPAPAPALLCTPARSSRTPRARTSACTSCRRQQCRPIEKARLRFCQPLLFESIHFPRGALLFCSTVLAAESVFWNRAWPDHRSDFPFHTGVFLPHRCKSKRIKGHPRTVGSRPWGHPKYPFYTWVNPKTEWFQTLIETYRAFIYKLYMPLFKFDFFRHALWTC